MMKQWNKEAVSVEVGFLYDQYSFRLQRSSSPDEYYKSRCGRMDNVKTVAEENEILLPSLSWLGNFSLVFMTHSMLCTCLNCRHSERWTDIKQKMWINLYNFLFVCLYMFAFRDGKESTLQLASYMSGWL